MRSLLASCLIAQVALSSVFGLSPDPAAATVVAVVQQTDIRNDPRVISAIELLEVWIDAQLAYE